MEWKYNRIALEQQTTVTMASQWQGFNATTEDYTVRTVSDNVTVTTNETTAMDPCAEICVFPVFDLVVNLCVVGVLCILGLFGNTLSIMVLQKERTNRVAVLLLQALAVADNACLMVSFVIVSIFMGLFPSLPDCGLSFNISRVYVHKYLTPFGYMSQSATIWMTVLLAANRYIAICRPFQAQSCLTLARAKIQVALVAIFSIFFNVPRMFQHEIVYHSETGKVVGLNESSIGKSSMFGQVYTNGLYSVLVLLIPFVLLLILNVQLIRELRASRQRMRRNSISPPEQHDENITFVMIIIIIVFLICHTPDRIIQIVHALLKKQSNGPCPRGLYYAQCICNLLFIVNSSVNFLIYYMFRKRFRRLLRTRVCGMSGSSQTDEYSVDSGMGGERVHLQSLRHTEICVPNGNGLAQHDPSESAALKEKDSKAALG